VLREAAKEVVGEPSPGLVPDSLRLCFLATLHRIVNHPYIQTEAVDLPTDGRVTKRTTMPNILQHVAVPLISSTRGNVGCINPGIGEHPLVARGVEDALQGGV